MSYLTNERPKATTENLKEAMKLCSLAKRASPKKPVIFADHKSGKVSEVGMTLAKEQNLLIQRREY